MTTTRTATISSHYMSSSSQIAASEKKEFDQNNEELLNSVLGYDDNEDVVAENDGDNSDELSGLD